MMNPKRLILLALCTGACMSASAWNAGDLRTDSIPSGSADTWTLQRCIYHALEQNIDIKMDMINAESAGIDEKTAKAAFLPSLNASIGQRIVNNPFSDTNTIIDGDQITSSTAKTNYNGSYGIDASWIIYNGSKRINTLKQQQTARETAELTVEQSKNTIIENAHQIASTRHLDKDKASFIVSCISKYLYKPRRPPRIIFGLALARSTYFLYKLSFFSSFTG